VLQTPRLRLREFTLADAPIVVALLNDAGFLKNVGDRGVQTVADAENYIADKFLRSYREHGFGLYLMELKESGEPVGMCGLVQRTYLDVPDIGASVLERYLRRGYTLEAATVVLEWARDQLGVRRIVGVTRATNAAAHGLLQKLGFSPERPIQVPGSDADWILFL
jgi:RimJ/RimL family protein N-acetyltransferase